MKWLFCILLVISTLGLKAQLTNPCLTGDSLHIVVLGSSTAAGAGASPNDSAWVWRYRSFLKAHNPAHQVTNLARGGYHTYKLMPSGFMPSDTTRPLPDTAKNITAALAQNPDGIIVNLPSNDRQFPVPETMFNFDTIYQIAQAANVPIWIFTTQPLGLYNARQVETRDSIFNYFGSDVIDVWYPLAQGDSLNPLYNSGDNTHLNNAGHRVIFNQVVNAGVAESLIDTPNFPDFTLVEVRLLDNNPCGSDSAQLQIVIANAGASSTNNLIIETKITYTDSNTTSTNFSDTLYLAIPTCGLDTHIINFNNSNIGWYSWDVELIDPSDSNSANNNYINSPYLFGQPNINTIYAIDTPLGCYGDTVNLRIGGNNNGNIVWYDDSINGNVIGTGDTLSIVVNDSLNQYYASLVRGPLTYANSLNATGSTTTNWNGIMFDVIADKALTIDSLSTYFFDASSQSSVKIYIKQGSHIGFETNAAAWTLQAIDSFVVNTSGNLVNVNTGSINLLAGDSLAFYIQNENSSRRLSYLSNGNALLVSNGDLNITNGSGASFNFGGLYHPRNFRGELHYTTGFNPNGDCASNERLAAFAIPDYITNFITNSVNVPLNDTTISFQDSIVLYAVGGNQIAQWSNGSNATSIIVNDNNFGVGNHLITSTFNNSNGCIQSDSIYITISASLCEDTLLIPQTSGSLYKAYNNINSNAVITPNGNVQFKAGTSIDLGNGFEVPINSGFSATIDSCQ